MDARALGAVSLRTTTKPFADVEIVWSWCPDAGTKCARRSVSGLRATGANKPGPPVGPPGRARINRNTIAQGRPDDSAFTCGSFPVRFLRTGASRVRRAPGLPCALPMFRGR
jgi:hypothetical protein